MNYLELIHKIKEGKTVYIFDDYADAAVKCRYDDSEQRTRTWIKRRWQPEHEVNHAESNAFDIEIGGDEISKDEYDNLFSKND